MPSLSRRRKSKKEEVTAAHVFLCHDSKSDTHSRHPEPSCQHRTALSLLWWYRKRWCHLKRHETPFQWSFVLRGLLRELLRGLLRWLEIANILKDSHYHKESGRCLFPHQLSIYILELLVKCPPQWSVEDIDLERKVKHDILSFLLKEGSNVTLFARVLWLYSDFTVTLLWQSKAWKECHSIL